MLNSAIKTLLRKRENDAKGKILFNSAECEGLSENLHKRLRCIKVHV